MLLQHRQDANALNWSRVAWGSANVTVKKGVAAATGPNPSDRSEAVKKRQFVVDTCDTQLCHSLTG